MRRTTASRSSLLVVLLALLVEPALGQDAKLRVLLLGDSTTIGSVCRQIEPSSPHLEDIVRMLLAAEPDLPPAEVVNQGRDGETIRELLASGRLDREIAPLPAFDYVFIRYGINDQARRESFETSFPADYAELLGRLRRQSPRATLVPTTIIPYRTPDRDEAVNRLIREVAEAQRLPLFDLHARYAASLQHGVNMLNYRRYPLDRIPERHRAWVQPFVREGSVVCMDNRLDAHFRDLPGWFDDRHPNLAGYHVIGVETARFILSRLRPAQPADPPAILRLGPRDPALIGLEYIDTSFENASPLWYEITADGTIQVYLIYDHERSTPNRAAGHIHFRIHAKQGAKLVLEFRNLDNIWNGRMASVAGELGLAHTSADGRSWQPVPLERLPGDRARLSVTMPGPELYVARVEPYRLSDLDAWMASIAGHPLVAIQPIGKTVEGRTLEIVRVGRPDACYRVFLRARAHPWEPGGNWVVQGLVDRLLRGDEEAGRYLDRYCLYVMPMANKDGVARGRTRFNISGKDLNRNWDRPADPVLAPENHALETWLEDRIKAGQKPHLALELHNDGNGRLHISRPPVPDLDRHLERMRTFEGLLRAHTWFTEGSTPGAFRNSGTLGDGWLQRYGIDAVVHEFNVNRIAGLDANPSAARWKQYGAQLARVFFEYFEVVKPSMRQHH